MNYFEVNLALCSFVARDRVTGRKVIKSFVFLGPPLTSALRVSRDRTVSSLTRRFTTLTPPKLMLKGAEKGLTSNLLFYRPNLTPYSVLRITTNP
jgi:hypothetical protein